jgi:hypothetical protein
VVTAAGHQAMSIRTPGHTEHGRGVTGQHDGLLRTEGVSLHPQILTVMGSGYSGSGKHRTLPISRPGPTSCANRA